MTEPNKNTSFPLAHYDNWEIEKITRNVQNLTDNNVEALKIAI